MILLNGWILPIGGASPPKGLRSTGLPSLVNIQVSVMAENCVLVIYDTRHMIEFVKKFAIVRTHWKMQCLPYTGFLSL